MTHKPHIIGPRRKFARAFLHIWLALGALTALSLVLGIIISGVLA